MTEHASATKLEPPPATPERSQAGGTPPRLTAGARARHATIFFLVAATVIALDQATKHIIRESLAPGEAWPDRDWFLNIVHVTNTGAAFGMLQGQTLFLVITSLVGVTAIVLYFLYPPMDHPVLRLALGLQLGGAAGNLIDRVRFGGEVTDFINFRHFPAFNVADSSISIGVVTILFFFLALEGDRWRDRPQIGD